MKKPYSLTTLIWLVSMLLWSVQMASGQSISSSNQGGDVCPNQVYTYSINTGCTPTWTVTGGKITQGQGTLTIQVI